MITVESPSMVLNDSRAAVNYTMDTTRTVTASMSQREVVNLVLAALTSGPATTLRNLILTAHGAPGFFQLGTGLSQATMGPFGDLRGKVYKIWFRGCLVGRIAGPQTAAHGDGAALRQYGLNTGDGHTFLTEFAKLTGCYVVAPTEMQGSNRTNYAQGLMDSYEGLVLSYDPQGRISWQHRYPSLYNHNTRNRTSTLPNWE